MARIRGRWWAVVGLACVWAAAGAWAAEAGKAPAAILKHAVICPPFKGDAAIAAIYHAEMTKMLKAAPTIEYFEGARRMPAFS